MLTFHPLRILELRPEAADAVCIRLEVPEALREAYRFNPGQHVGVRASLGGEEIRRTYSICSGTDEGCLSIGVRLQDRGSMSRFLSQQRVGGTLDILTPTGRFFVEPDPNATRTLCAFAAGSGITPILGILKNILRHEPKSRFLLFYGNRTADTIMFAEELLALKDRHPDRFALHFILSREPQEVELLNGRLDAQKVAALGRDLFDPAAVDAYLICGPGTMIDTVREGLVQLGVDPSRIHAEHFTSDATPSRQLAQPAMRPQTGPEPEASIQVTVVMDGRQRSFAMKDNGSTVLEAAEEAGLDLPYSCRAGVCSTCRARVVRGAVTMMTNYALEPWEVEAGYVLCCQALPASAELELSYDER